MGVYHFWFHYTVVLLMFSVVHSSSHYRDDWVDPDDIMNYDRASKSMIKADRSRLIRDNWLDPDSPNIVQSNNENCDNSEHIKSVLEFKEKLTNCESMLISLEKSASAATVNIPENANEKKVPVENIRSNSMPTSEMIFMKRFVSILLQASGLASVKLGVNQSKQGKIIMDVSEEQLATLQRFGIDDDVTTLGQLDDVLSKVLQSSESIFDIRLGWMETLTHFFSTSDVVYRLTPYVCTLLVIIMVISQQSPMKIVVTFLLLVFALGYQWTYNFLIKKEEIDQFVTMSQLKDIPESCQPINSIFGYVKQMFLGRSNDCHKYYTAQMMSPPLVITPTIVLSEMLAGIVVQPMGKVGDGIAKFCSGILDGLPWFQGYIVLLVILILATVIVLAIIVTVCGGRIRLPFYLGGLEFASHQTVRVPITNPLRSALPERVQEITAPATSTPPVNVHIHLDSLRLMPRETPPLAERATDSAPSIQDSPSTQFITNLHQKAISDSELGKSENKPVTTGKESFVNPGDVAQCSSPTTETFDKNDRLPSEGCGSSFLESIENILNEPEGSTDPCGSPELNTSINSEFITSIENIILEASTDDLPTGVQSHTKPAC